MPPPRIGITTYHRDGAERESFALPTPYVDAVRAAGGLPLLLPPGEPDPALLLDGIHGLVFGGGGDLSPALYGGDAHGSNYSVCAERDRFELELFRAALARRVPVLAICRGMQVLNLVHGGTLHGHLPDVVGEDVSHRFSQTRHTLHPVRLAPGSRLRALFASDEIEIASWHHQAVAEVGAGLEPVAWAEDGTVEALEMAGHPALWAVQWHPELQIEPGSPQLALFGAFTEASARASSDAGLRGPG